MTQAQIEAAANAIRIRLFEVGIDPVDGLAKAALTAAAEVDDTEWTCADCDLVQRGHRFRCEKCGFYIGRVDTAAAEVVGDNRDIIAADAGYTEGWNNAIERCAKVLDERAANLEAQDNHAAQFAARALRNTAAAIRALKEER